MIFQAIGLGLSLFQMGQARSDANAAQAEADKNKQLSFEAAQDKHGIDQLQLQATQSARIADVRSQDAQIEQMQRASELMGMQGQADSVIRKEEYNKLAANQMVMGAAQGRSMDGGGSFQAIADKSLEDFKWDLMWNENSVKMGQVALYEDMMNVREAQATTLMLGTQQDRIAGMGIDLDLQNAARGLDIQSSQANQAWRTSNTQATNSFINNFGASGLKSLLGAF